MEGTLLVKRYHTVVVRLQIEGERDWAGVDEGNEGTHLQGILIGLLKRQWRTDIQLKTVKHVITKETAESSKMSTVGIAIYTGLKRSASGGHFCISQQVMSLVSVNQM